MIFKQKTKEQKAVEEIREEAKRQGVSVEKLLFRLVPREPIQTGYDVYKNFVLEVYSCPSCGRPVGDEMFYFSYCPLCGQNIERVKE